MWLVAALVLAPALIPFGALLGRVIGDAGDAIAAVATARTVSLVRNTLLLVVSVSATAGVIGIAAAWTTERTNLPWRPLWRVAAALPLVIPSYVIALALLSATGGNGLIASWLPDVQGGIGAWMALSISTYPYVYLVAAATLRRLDPAHEEAARGLGAAPSRVFLTIVLPQLRPAVGAGMLLSALYTLSDFGAVSLMRFDAFTRVVYTQYAGRLDRTPAAALAVLLVLLALTVLWFEQRTRGRAAYHSPVPQRPVSRAPLSLRARIGSTTALATLAAIALVLPVGTLVAWVVRSSAAGPGATVDWAAAGTSVTASILAAIVAVLAAIPVSVLVTRHVSRATAWVERLSYAVFALPHITVALGMVFFASRFLGGLYQSLTVLVMVYAAVFFAQALGSGRAAMLAVDPALEEASRGLGRSRLTTLVRITLPLAWRGIAAGGVLVFLTTMKELPVTLILRPTEFETLSVRIWSAANDLLYARAAGAALLLVAVSAIPMYLLATRDAP
jgi:iron(III) transport system permease protein